MHRTLVQIVASVLLVIGIASGVWASGGHVTSVSVTPSGGLTVTATATAAGLGDGQYTASLNVSGTALYNCQNGGGNYPSPKGPITSTTPGTPVSFSADHNGNGTFTTSTTFSPPQTISGAAAACHGGQNWTGVLVQGSAKVTGAELIVTGGHPSTTIFDQFYTF